MIVNFHVTEQKTPRLKEIYKKCCEDVGYTGSRESLRGEIHKLGFCAIVLCLLVYHVCFQDGKLCLLVANEKLDGK
jgi:hypothetical protein